MNVLVVDDDGGVRMFLERLLVKKFRCTVLEAKDGLEALSIIQSKSLDLVFLDIQMPIIDGFEVLEAIRYDPAHTALPVIVMSVASDKADTLRLIRLGISDYILKPLRAEMVYKRVCDVLAKKTSHSVGYEPPALEGQHECNLLLVDKDPNFRAFFSSVLGGRFEIKEAMSGVEGLEMYVSQAPKIVCLGEGLSLLTEVLLARKIRELDKSQQTAIYVCAEVSRSTNGDRSLFDGFLKKTFVPEVFEKEFMSVVMNEKDLYETVLGIVRKELSPEVVTAMQQTIGVMSSQEIQVLEIGEENQIASEVYATVDLLDKSENFRITVALVASQADVIMIAGKILGFPAKMEDGAGDAFGELVNTIGGRVRSSIEIRGIEVGQLPQQVVSKSSNPMSFDWQLCLPFATGGGEKYYVGVAVTKLK